jgi:hypothetical protein
MKKQIFWFLITIISVPLLSVKSSLGQNPDKRDFDFFRDRGVGIPTSLFGTYVEKHDVILYPFYEYYVEKENEYNPLDLGFNADQTVEGRFSAHEELIYAAYGISNWLMIEAEGSIIQATQKKSEEDTSDMTSSFMESGIENIEGQLRWRYWKENQNTPELYSYFLTVIPTQGTHKMIGTDGYEFKFGTGLIKGFSIGTISLNTSVQYNTEANEYEFGGVTIEYLKRINKWFRVYVGAEGIPDATELITEVQIFPKPWMFIRLNNAIGLSPAATDIAPEVGLLMYLNRISK